MSRPFVRIVKRAPLLPPGLPLYYRWYCESLKDYTGVIGLERALTLAARCARRCYPQDGIEHDK